MGTIGDTKLIKGLALSSALVAAIAVSSQAQAADMLLDPPVIEAPVVEATGGWYLRGDITYDFQELRGAYAYSNGGPGGGPEEYRDAEVDDSWDVGIGIGYQITDYLRVDGTAEYVFESDFTGGLGCNPVFTPACTTGVSSEKASVSMLKLMANVYADLGHFNGLTPYVGAGIGGAYVKYEDYMQNVATPPASPNHKDGESWRFSYALHAGVSYDLTQNTKIDFGYTYNRIEDGEMVGYDITNANTHPQAFDEGFNNHVIHAGIRYSFH